jgi:hypothetical protein
VRYISHCLAYPNERETGVCCVGDQTKLVWPSDVTPPARPTPLAEGENCSYAEVVGQRYFALPGAPPSEADEGGGAALSAVPTALDPENGAGGATTPAPSSPAAPAAASAAASAARSRSPILEPGAASALEWLESHMAEGRGQGSGEPGRP